jgi:nucleotide-binding universal stress UspA family protein
MGGHSLRLRGTPSRHTREHPPMHTRIVVPLDGSEVSEAALPEATSQAKAFGLPLHLVRVVDTRVVEQVGGSAAAFNYTMLGEMFEDESNDAQQYVAGMVKRLEGEGFTVTSDVRVGPVAQAILDDVQEGDLIVMGSHGRSGLRRWVLGSVAEEVLRHAKVPVLMVKMPHTDS